MSARQEVVEFWDAEIQRWVTGDDVMSPETLRWFRSYSGKGDGAVDLTVFPEPYVGPLAGGSTPALVMLGLNPGPPAPDFQNQTGLFARQIAESSYGRWAASGPYTGPEWETAKGRNKYHRDRLTFARRLNADDSIQADQLLYMELFPFHSKRVTGPIAPPADLLSRFVFSPLAELDVEFFFAFGKPWFRAAESLGFGAGICVWVDWTRPSRQAKSFHLPSGQRLIVLSQGGYAGPPGLLDTDALRQELYVRD